MKDLTNNLPLSLYLSQNDADLVLEFVFNQGLNALVQVGQYSDQTYQQYILKALGELVLYVDGMHGLIQCNEIIQWLYELTRSKVRDGRGMGGEDDGRWGYGRGMEW